MPVVSFTPLVPNTPENVNQLNTILSAFQAGINAVDGTQIVDGSVGLTDLSSAITGALIPAAVTSLPGSPSDGQQVYFVADATNGVIWHLRYRSASASTYKWEFVGGSELTAIDTSYIYFSSSTLGDAGVPVEVVVPVAGDYLVSLGAARFSTDSANTIADMYATNASNTPWAGTHLSAASFQGSGTPYMSPPAGRGPVKVAAVAAGSKFANRVQSITNGVNGTAEGRYIAVRPIRVG